MDFFQRDHVTCKPFLLEVNEGDEQEEELFGASKLRPVRATPCELQLPILVCLYL